MSRSIARWVARLSWALTAALSVATMILASVNAPLQVSYDSFSAPLIVLAMAAIGALVASKRPENLIGWVFCATALLSVTGMLAQEYAVTSLMMYPGALPGGLPAAWLGAWISELGFGLLISFTLLLFPTGSLPTPRWRPVGWLLALLLALATLSRMFRAGPLGDRYPLAINPLGVQSVSEVIDLLDHTLFVAAQVISVAAAVVRFRRARGVERQQLKWFTYAVMILIAGFALDVGIEAAAPRWSQLAESIVSDLTIGFVVVAIGLAVLRYRLYDIDIIIRRTLIYALVTGTLALFYWGSVVALQTVLRPIVGEGNDLAIVISTLLIAALFLPLRRGIQGLIDRRFYRRKYDAARALTLFSQAARDEVDLRVLTARLVEVVDETVQPAQVSLWLRNTE